MLWLIILGIALLGGGLIVLLVKVTLMVLEKGAGEAIGGSLDAADFISRTGLAPPSWGIPQAQKVREWIEADMDADELERRKERFKRRLLRRLRKLRRFIRNTSVMDSEKSRERMVNLLSEMLQDWRTRNWENIVGF